MTAVLWQASDGGSEVCVLERAGRGWRLRGTVLTHEARRPIELRYAITVDSAWATTGVEVLVAFAGSDPRELAHLSEVWSGTERPRQYSDCVDVDLSFTPATNTLPIRRLGLEVGEEAEIHVVWLVWPELSVRRVPQRYARLAQNRYRYTQDEFEAGLIVDRARSRVRGALARDRLDLASTESARRGPRSLCLRRGREARNSPLVGCLTSLTSTPTNGGERTASPRWLRNRKALPPTYVTVGAWSREGLSNPRGGGGGSAPPPRNSDEVRRRWRASLTHRRGNDERHRISGFPCRFRSRRG